MGKAGGIIGLIGGIFAVMAAIFTLLLGGFGTVFDAKGAGTVVDFGWYGLAAAFLVIVFGAVAIAKPSTGAFGLFILSLVGAVVGGTAVAICLALAFLGGLLAAIGTKNAETGKQTWWQWSGIPLGIAAAFTIVLQMAEPPKQVSEAPQTMPVIISGLVSEKAPEPVTIGIPEIIPVVDVIKPASAPAQQHAESECPAASDDMMQSFNCQEKALGNADAALNLVYKTVMSSLSQSGQDELRTSQRAWIKDKEECSIPVGAGASGMLGEIMASECKTEKTMERTKFLLAYKSS